MWYCILQDKNGVGFSDFEIREEANNFIFGGHDTSASGINSDHAVDDSSLFKNLSFAGISWILYCLAKYPEHQELCRQEVKDIMGDSDEVAL